MIRLADAMSRHWMARGTAGRGACVGVPAVAVVAATLMVSMPTAGTLHAKTPGKTYCFNRVCHRVLTLGETQRVVGKSRSVIASYYSDCRVDRYNPCGLTSSGTVFHAGRDDNAASPIYPNGTRLLVWNPSNRRTAVVRIYNAGPYWGRRTLDLSRAAATKLGFRHQGVARLMVVVLSAPTPAEARYRRRRVYPPVPGYIGRFASLDAAYRQAGSVVDPTVGAPVAIASLPQPAGGTALPVLPQPAPPTVAAPAAAATQVASIVPLPVTRPAFPAAVREALSARDPKEQAQPVRVAAVEPRERSTRRSNPRRKEQPSRVTASARPVQPKANAQAQRTAAASAAAAAPPRPDMSWRRQYFGISGSSS